MKKIFVLIFSIAILSQVYGQDQERTKACFAQAKNEITGMLEGKSPLSFEKAVFLMENAYYDNRYTYDDFKQILDVCIHEISSLTVLQQDRDTLPIMQGYTDTDEKRRERYEKALNNYAIYTFLTDTTYNLWLPDSSYTHFFVQRHLPFSYPIADPLGSNDWKNTQVINLLLNNKGNCSALSSLYKIFANRLQTGAQLCTAPGHIYIRHADENGTLFNVELATASFPGTGSIKTLTYTTTQAIKNGIALRQLNEQQSVTLCLVYLAKGYQHHFGTIEDDFIMDCAETALRFDSLNLNALLLKAELYEHRIIAQNENLSVLQNSQDFKVYENLVNVLYSKGYREMPLEMKNMIVSSLAQDSIPLQVKDHTPVTFKGVKNQTRYASLSWGMFEEMHENKPTEKYGMTLFDTQTRKIKGFEKADSLYNHYDFDPVVFAWNIDPLAAKYPYSSPYAAFNNNPVFYFDPDGKEGIGAVDHKAKTVTIKAVYYVEVGTEGFNQENLDKLNNINPSLNSKEYKITDKSNALHGYAVQFDLKFVPVRTAKAAQKFAIAEKTLTEGDATGGVELIVGGQNIANSIILTDDATFEAIPTIKSTAEKFGAGADKVLGITDGTHQHINIPEKSRNDNLAILHEIFHTLYFNQDGASTGIAGGKEQPLPEEINVVIKGLQENNRIVESEKK